MMGETARVPDKVYLTWKENTHGDRYVVGELSRSDGIYSFKYPDGEDLSKAKSRGFEGHPAFELDTQREFSHGVLDVFASRLPDRSRPDFQDLLSYWHIADQEIDEYALIAITGARLPTDNFEFIAPFGDLGKCVFYTEVAGLSHTRPEVIRASLGEGTMIVWGRERDNPNDPFAVGVIAKDNRIGYVKKVHAEAVARAIDANKQVEGTATDIQANGVLRTVQLKVAIP